LGPEPNWWPDIRPASPNEQSIRSKLHKVWHLIEHDMTWAEETIDDDTEVDRVQAHLDTAKAAVDAAVSALARRGGWREEEPYQDFPTDESVQMIRNGYRFSDHETGLTFKSGAALLAYMREEEGLDIDAIVAAPPEPSATQMLLDSLAVRVACPECDARAGVHCDDKEPHESRLVAALRLALTTVVYAEP
jgi:hypothetical protein